jgi:integrase
LVLDPRDAGVAFGGVRMRLFKRGETWCVDYSYKGQRVRRAVGHSKKIAELTLKDIELKIAKGENLGIHDLPHLLFRDYSREYLEFSKANKGESSWVRDCVSMRHLVEALGDKYLFAVAPKQIEEYKKHRLDKGGAQPATVNRELATLRHMFNKAVEWGYVKDTPVKGVRMLKIPPGRLRFLEASEIARLVDECSPHLRPIVVTALNTGMRLSEILCLRWSQVNFRLRTITVERTKNNERRIIPVNQPLFLDLERLAKKKRTEFVFCDEDGKPFRSVQTGFKAACRRAGIADFRFHDLRHTFASHLVMSGVNIRAVQQLLGHKDIKMTMRYSHLSPQHLQEAVGLLGLSLTGRMHADGSLSGGASYRVPDAQTPVKPSR